MAQSITEGIYLMTQYNGRYLPNGTEYKGSYLPNGTEYNGRYLPHDTV